MPFSSTVIQTEPYTPNGATNIFPFFFLALSAQEVQVVLTDSDGVETLLSSGFDVYGVGEPTGGYVQFTVAPNYAGQTLTIRAAPNMAQEVDFENQGPFNPRELNKVLDRLAQKILVIRDGLGVADGGVGTVTWASIQGKPSAFTPLAHVHAATDITSGVLDAARIPGLDASKISGGTLATARIPGLDASKITSGTIDQARLPALGGGVVSSGGIAALTGGQQATIVEGTLVTTTDGKQWRYSGSGSKTSEASYVELSTSASWSGVTGKPAKVTNFAGLTGGADKLGYFSGTDALSQTDFTAEGRAIVGLASTAALRARASVLTTKGDISVFSNAPDRLPAGTNGQVLTADSAQATGLRWANPTGGGGGGGNWPNFVTVFSGNGDNSTNNDAAFLAAAASAFETIFLPEGTYLTTLAQSQLVKEYVGPGVIRFGTSAVVPNIKWLQTPITRRDFGGVVSEYGESSAQISFGDIQYQYIGVGTRKNVDVNSYFHAGAMGTFRRFFNLSGASGTTAHLSATATAGATTAQLYSVADLNIGDVILFSKNDDIPDYAAGEKVTITNISGLQITFTPALAQTYTVTGTDYFPTWASGYPKSPHVTRGYRTLNALHFAEVVAGADGGGDTYGHLLRVVNSYQIKGGQTHFFDAATVAAIGGDMQFTGPGQYGTPWEFLSADNGNDVSVINVDSYVRNNDTGAYGAIWMHNLIKSEGARPVDVCFELAGPFRVGLDTVRADFSGHGEAAIQLKLGQRIYFDGSANSGIGQRGRGLWGNILGDTYITGFNDGSDAVDIFAGATRVARFRSGSVNFSQQVNAASHVNVAGQVGVAPVTGRLGLDGINGNTFLQYDGSIVRLWVNGSVKQTWGP